MADHDQPGEFDRARTRRGFRQNEPTERTIPLSDLAPAPGYPEKRLQGLDDLCASITESRVIVPLMVVPAPADTGRPFVILDGHRRVAVARTLGVTALRCLVYPTTEPAAVAFARMQEMIAAENEAGRRAWENQQQAAMGLPPLTDAEAEAAAETRAAREADADDSDERAQE